MNPLTLVKRIKEINSKEAALGISESASWHAKYKDSPYVFVGGVPFDLSEGDLLAIFSQYGEIVDVNLVRDKATGKPKGFGFVAYEDQRSTNLAVDNLNGASVLGRIIRVDHVSKYKKKEEEDEELEQQKREERGVCRAFQRGDCTRGASCKFSHNEQRAANTGWGAKEDAPKWGAKEDAPKWGHDKHEGPSLQSGSRGGNFTSCNPESRSVDAGRKFRPDDKDKRLPIGDDDKRRERLRDRRSEKYEKEANDNGRDRQEGKSISRKYESEPNSRDDRDQARRGDHDSKERPGRHELEPNQREDHDRKARDNRSVLRDSDRKPREDHDRREKSGRHESESYRGRHESESYRREDGGRKAKEDYDRKDKSRRHESESHRREGGDMKEKEDLDRKEKSGRHVSESNPREDGDKSRRHEAERNRRDDYDRRDSVKRSRYDEDSSSCHHREEEKCRQADHGGRSI